MSTSHEVLMEVSKMTKGAVQYKEVGLSENPGYLIGTLYLRRTGMVLHRMANHPEYPSRIRVTVETVK